MSSSDTTAAGKMGIRAGAAERLDQAASLGRIIHEAYAQRTVLGTFLIELPTRATIKALALAGFDFVILDLEHSAFGVESLPALISEAHLVNLPALVRISSHDSGLITKVLDAGANGIMAPHVSNAAQARKIIEAARYMPLGERGLAPLIGFANLPRSQIALDPDIVVMLQIEGEEGVAHCGEIAKVPGVSGLFVGPYDLSQALGIPGEVEHPRVAEAAIRVAAEAGTEALLGVYVHDPRRSALWSERGFRFQCIGFDGRMMLEGAKQFVGAARSG
jgi:2-keto-3-deoxy-L-rhamnonate aldolase RhmA